ncbi:MAG: hypothetical protein RR576_06285 [Oscillospiraceae bacterium]
MNHMNGLIVVQDRQMYYLFTPQGIQIATISMGADNQLTQDVMSLKYITLALAKRWGIVK